MNRLFLALCALGLALPCGAADPASTPTLSKPKLKVAADGFPAGHATPEGAACDLARAFIADDAALFTTTCLPSYGESTLQDTYKNFLHGVITSFLKLKSLKLEPDPTAPKSIAKVFAARHLSGAGPAAAAHGEFGFQDVMFVDVDGQLNNGEHAINRTLVIKSKDGQWYADPAPEVSPQLADGLDDEAASTKDFAEAYDLEH